MPHNRNLSTPDGNHMARSDDGQWIEAAVINENEMLFVAPTMRRRLRSQSIRKGWDVPSVCV